MTRHGGGGGGREEPPGQKPHLLVWGGGGRGTPTPSPRDAEEKAGGGQGRDQAPTPGRGDEGSMGAKESRIGFLSYEEALRRGEGGRGLGELLGRPRRAAQRVGDGEGEGRGRGGEGVLRAWGA